jgi:hypothetical protein
MKKLSIIFLVSFIALNAFCQKPVQTEFVNDICLPGKLYMLEGVQNDIFVQPLIKRWRPYHDVVRFSGTAKYSRRLESVASITQPEDGRIVTLDLINTDEFDTVKSLSAEVLTGKPGVGEGKVKVSVIGDSFTQGTFFKSALLENNYIPGIKMIGLCQVKDHPGQFHEGRGGWTLSRYFSISKDRTHHYNGFWQPDGNYRYWGSTAYWKMAKQVAESPNPQNWQFMEHYSTIHFIGISSEFDPKGLKLNPIKNDLMYDNEAESFIRFDGENWKKVKYEDFEWSFNYGKYLKMWKLEPPEILAEFLGLNDFRNAGIPGKLDFEKWNDQMELMIASYHSAVPDGKFVLMIPSSSNGILNNENGEFTLLQNANMWEVRKNIIENFDNRTDENIYVVDAGIAIDNYYGTRFLDDSTYTLPYAGFEGESRLDVQTGNPHPYPNYPTMGISLAAFIQYYRMK